MRDKIVQAFDQVHAEDSLKQATKAYLSGQLAAGTRKPIPWGLRLVPVAACLALIVFGGGWLYFTPTLEISIDINPSIELGVNRFDRVVSVTGDNEDGQALLDSLSLEHLNYNDAVELIINSEEVSTLLSGDGVMTIGVIGPDGEQTTRVLSDMEACTSQSENMHCYHADNDMADEAHEVGLSCGKYRAFVRLQSLDPSVTAEEAANMTMREIWDRIEALTQATGESAAPQTSTGAEQESSWSHDGQQHHEEEHESGYRHGWADD